jgi:hypothetical protein
MRDAAVKVCEDKHNYMCSRAAEAIAALPIIGEDNV